MKRSKMLAALMLAGLCGISESEAKSSKSEIKSLERQRSHYQEEHQESKARLKELSPRGGKSSDGVVDDEGEAVREEISLKIAQWDRMNPDLIKEREAEAARVKATVKEMAKIDRAIRKEKARERERRLKVEVGLP